MKIDLASILKRSGRTRDVTLPVIVPTQAMVSDLARIYIQVPRLVATFTKERLLPAYERALKQAAVRDGLSSALETTRNEFASHGGGHLPAVGNMVRDDIPELQLELDFLEAELNRLVLRLTPDMRALLLKVERWHRRKWIGNILTATGVSLDMLIGPDDMREPIQAVLARNIDLIKSVAAEAKARTADAIWRGFQARSRARVVAKEIQAALEVSRRRALNIASDQMQKLSSDLDAERMRDAGIEQWKWRSSHKLHFRPEHAARDGKIYTDKTAPKDLPGQLPFCGCKRQAHLSID